MEGTFKVERSPAASPLIPVLEAPADELKIEHSGRMESTPPAPAELPVLDAPSDELKIEHTGEQI